MNTAGFLLAATSALAALPLARATEGAMGRPISGAGIMPYAGIVPPTPGAFYVAVGEIWYAGDIGASRATPVGASLALDLDAKVSFTPVTLLHAWETSDPAWSFASSLTVPILWTEATANVTVGPRTGRVSDEAFGIYDLVFTPFVAGRHFSATEHASLGLTVWAPTGAYDSADLANLGMNCWTFIPTVAYTRLLPDPNVELSASWGVQFYTENPDTDYRSGILSDFEFLAVKRLSSGFGFGLVGSWIEQLSDDQGGRSAALDGFRGRALGAGPVLTFAKKIAGRDLSGDLRWVHEFETKNRFEGDAVTLNLSAKL